LDTIDVEVYGNRKRVASRDPQARGGVQPPRLADGRTHVAHVGDTSKVLAADLLSRGFDPRRVAAELLRRALAGLPARRGPGGSGDAPMRATSPGSCA
jgi:hypothetical protein